MGRYASGAVCAPGLVRYLASIAGGLLCLMLISGASAQSDDGNQAMGSVVGRVVDGSGNPLGGAQLIVVDLQGVNAVAADDGSFEIDGVLAGDHVLIGQINGFVGDAIGVSVPANDVVAVDVVLAVPPPPPPTTDTGPPPTDVPTSTPTATPNPTPTPAPAATATATPVPAALVVTLSGTVRDDQGAAPPNGTRVQLLDLPIVSTTVGGDGNFTLADIPAGATHFVFASAPQKSPSDVQSVSFSTAPVAGFNLNLRPFGGGGNPTEFSGRVVVTGGGSGVGGATVWRLGAAGRTMTAPNGTFVLIDATRSSTDSSSSPGKPPDKVTLVAVNGDRWGFRNIDTNNPPRPLVIALDHTGGPPAPPRVFNWRSNFPADQAQFFTARWKSGQHKDLGIRLVLPDKTVKNPGGNGIGQCVGDCGGISQSGLVVTLPPGLSFTIQAWNEDNDAPEPYPDWDEAQVVSG